MPTVARAEPPRRFPLLLIVFCGALAVVLFFSSTVPAAAERSRLREIEEHRRRVLQLLERGNRELEQTELGLQFDPQTVLVEIDELGLTPEQLLVRYPEPVAPPPGSR